MANLASPTSRNELAPIPYELPDDNNILRSPFLLEIVPAPSLPSMSSILPDKPNQMGTPAGLVRSFYLQSMDKFGNFARYDDLAGPDRFFVSLVPEIVGCLTVAKTTAQSLMISSRTIVTVLIWLSTWQPSQVLIWLSLRKAKGLLRTCCHRSPCSLSVTSPLIDKDER